MQKKGKSVKIAGKKNGMAKVQAILGKRKLICKVTVKEKPTEKFRTTPKSVPVYKPAPIPIRKPDSSSKPKVTVEPGILVSTMEIDLYAIDSQNSKLEIPSNYSQKYQIKLPEAGTAVYRIVSGKSAQVSDTGLITPVCTTYYWNGNLGSTVSSGAEGERTTKEYRYGTTILEAKVKQNIYRYIITVNNNARTYTDQVMDAYIAKHITPSMTNREKLDKIAEFPCQYDYSADRSSAIGMVIDGGGDCWASTDAIIWLCKKVGFAARVRDGRGDAGTGSGHMNALAKVDDQLYIVEAGYNEKAPRAYRITTVDEYNYTVNPDQETVTLTCYNGLDSKVSIPKYVDGYRVTAIGEQAFIYRDEMRSVTFPDSIIKIGARAFYDTGLQMVNIPNGVVEIGDQAFSSVIDYYNPDGGAYGRPETLEVIELPASVQTFGVNLRDSVVLYHGSKEQWEKIKFTDTYQAPEEGKGKVFYNSRGLEVSEHPLEMQKGSTREINVYVTGKDVSVTSADAGVMQVSLQDDVEEYYYYRDGSGEHVTRAAKILAVTAVGEGTDVLTISNGDETVSVPVTVRG